MWLNRARNAKMNKFLSQIKEAREIKMFLKKLIEENKKQMNQGDYYCKVLFILVSMVTSGTGKVK